MKFKVGDMVKLTTKEQNIKLSTKDKWEFSNKLKIMTGKIVKIKDPLIYVNWNKFKNTCIQREDQLMLLNENKWNEEQL